MKYLLYVVAFGLTGCDVPVEDLASHRATATARAGRTEDGLWDNQGEPLLGGGKLRQPLDRAYGVLVGAHGEDGEAFPHTMTDASGRIVQAGQAWESVRFAGRDDHGETIYFSAYAHDDDEAGRPRYWLLWGRQPDYSDLNHFCHAGYPPYALPGRFEADGTFVRDERAISFACPGSASFKAIEWGLLEEPAEVFQAGTRLARADYCGVGRPHTINDTPIVLADPRALDDEALATISAAGYRFEAAWTGAGALCIARWRYQSLAADECGAEVDPRSGGDGFFCDDLAAAADAGASLVSFSRASDEVGLWSWQAVRDGAAFEVATDLGNLIDLADADANVYPPYFGASEYHGAHYLASIVKQPREEMIPLRLLRWRAAPDVYFATAKHDYLLDEWEVVADLGYIYPPDYPVYQGKAGERQRVMLQSYSHVVDGVIHYRLFRADQAPVADPAYKLVRDEGYALR